MSASVHSTTTAMECIVEIVPKKVATFDDIINTARESYIQGRTQSAKFRKDQLRNLLRMYKDKEYEMVESLNCDLGKSSFEASLFEIEFLKNDLLNVVYNFESWIKPKNAYRRMMDLFSQAQIYRDAYGVVYIVGAWNYPLQSTLLPLASAIAAGNCVVLQPPSQTKRTRKFLMETLHIYLDAACYLLSDVPITKNCDIDYLFFTGTFNEAKRLQALCSKSLTPGTFVVGSQNPVYIDASADILLTVQRVMWGKCVNAGQTCIAPGYVLCTKDVMASFIRAAPAVVQQFYGNPKESPDYARIISEEHFDRLASFLNGKEIAYGGEHDRKSLYFQPTILANVTPNYALMYDQTYGPILPIVVIQSVDETIAFLNAREKPLALYIFAKNSQVVEQLITRTSSGGVTVNDVLMHFAAESLPFGGVGASGFGCYHGKKTFETFTHAKSVLKKPLSVLVQKVEQIRYPPYTDRNHYLLKQLMRKRASISTRWLKFVIIFLFGILFGFVINYN